MLKVFRDNLKYLSWVLWFVIAVFILFVFVDFGGTVPGGGGFSDTAVTVGKQEISFAEFERAYRRTEDIYREAYGGQFTAEQARQIGLPAQVLQGLVSEKILAAEADRMGVRVTDSEVRRQILSYPVFLDEDGRFVGEEAYARTLRANGYTVEGFEEATRAQLMTDKVRSILQGNVYVSDEEVESSYRSQIEKAKIRFVKLPTARFRDQVVLAPEEIESHYQAHLDDFRVPERRVADYLLVDQDELRAALEISDEEVSSYYRENQDEFRSDEQVRARHILLRVGDQRTAEQARQELEAVRTRIQAGEDFGELARTLSEDPGNRDQGGDLGFFGRGEMVPEFEQAAFDASPGEVVGPVSTSFGAHLIEVLERRPAGVRPLDEVSAQIRDRLLVERSRTAAENKARELADRVRAEKIADAAGMAALADGESGVSVRTTDPFGEEDHVAGIGRSTAFTIAAFDLDVGAVSEPVKIGQGWAILRLAAIEEPRTAELEEVRAEVEDALRTEREIQLAIERLSEANLQITAGKTLDEVAVGLDVEVEESALFGRHQSVGSLGRNHRVIREALRLDEGAVGGPMRYDGGALLFEVTERTRFDPADFEQNREATRERLEGERFGELVASLIDRRREELQVRYAPELIQNFDLLTETPGL